MASLTGLCETLGPRNERTYHAIGLFTVHLTDELQGTSQNDAPGKKTEYRVAIIAKG